MDRNWVDAEHLKAGSGEGDPWDVDFRAHPMLDPHFTTRSSRVGHFFKKLYQRIESDDRTYIEEFQRLMAPLSDGIDVLSGPEECIPFLNQADVYINEMRALLPDDARRHVKPDPRITACNDMRTLFSILFDTDSERVRYEAQRKLYLMKLLLDIEHSRRVQDGPRHKAYFERLLREGLWERVRDTNTVEIGFDIAEDGQSIKYNLHPRPGQQRWSFQSMFLECEAHGQFIPLDVLYYNCRFKRTVTPISYKIVDGRHEVVERKRWDALGRNSSGSIMSKMIRKGITNPNELTDLLGAMFIVHDEECVEDLLTLLDAVVGNPIGWRNVTDTLIDPQEKTTLNRYSGEGYKVFKGDLGILHPNHIKTLPPYLYHVEVQIYTLEGFLRTVHGAHDASHLALKLRQFLHGIVPIVFPRAIYGDGWLSL